MNKKINKTKSIELSSCDSAIKLRGSIEPSEFINIVLSLIFLKCIGDTFKSRYRN